jgi:hypothetical protein
MPKSWVIVWVELGAGMLICAKAKEPQAIEASKRIFFMCICFSPANLKHANNTSNVF